MSALQQDCDGEASAAFDLVRAAMSVRSGEIPAPDPAEDVLYRDDHFVLTKHAIWFETPGGVRFHYRKGGTVLAHVPGPDRQEECELYLGGTVFGAVAWLNGHIPLHASAIVSGGAAIAFSADSGGGKSTLAAALATRGYPHLSDDTLVLCRDADGRLHALPDGKRMKLSGEALQMTGVPANGAIELLPGKYFADAPCPAAKPAPLRALFFLEWAEQEVIEEITGAEKLSRLGEALYRPFIHAALTDNEDHARMMFALAHEIPVWVLGRRRDSAAFARIMDDVENMVKTAVFRD